MARGYPRAALINLDLITDNNPVRGGVYIPERRTGKFMDLILIYFTGIYIYIYIYIACGFLLASYGVGVSPRAALCGFLLAYRVRKPI